MLSNAENKNLSPEAALAKKLTSVAAVPCSVFDETVDGIEDFF